MYWPMPSAHHLYLRTSEGVGRCVRVCEREVLLIHVEGGRRECVG